MRSAHAAQTHRGAEACELLVHALHDGLLELNSVGEDALDRQRRREHAGLTCERGGDGAVGAARGRRSGGLSRRRVEVEGPPVGAQWHTPTRPTHAGTRRNETASH